MPQVQHIKKQPLLKVINLLLCELLGKTVAQRCDVICYQVIVSDSDADERQILKMRRSESA